MTFLGKIFKKKSFDDFEEELKSDKYKPKKFDFEEEDKEFSHSLGRGSTKVGNNEMDEEDDFVPSSSYKQTRDQDMNSDFGSPLRSAPLQTKPMQDQQIDMMRRDIEVINAKLDAIRSSLETMNMKISTIEKIALQESNR